MKKEQQKTIALSLLNIALYVFYFLLILTFFFLLDKQKSLGFGFTEILIALAGSILLASFLIWVKSMMPNNSLLSLIFGLIIVGSLLYALFIRFNGPYTLTFAAIGSLASVAYLLFYFFKYRHQSN